MKQFSLRDIQRASGTKPVPAQKLDGHLERVGQGLLDLQRAASPSLAAWRDLSDAINILESLKEMGLVADDGDEITRAKDAMGEAGARHQETGTLRLSGPGIQTLRALLDDYSEVVRGVTERDFIRACYRTEARIRQILRGNVRAGDRVIAI